MTRFTSDPTDLRITGYELSTYAYALAHSNYSNDGQNIRVGQNHSSGYWYVYRSFLKFDTSAIPDGDTVTAATLGLRVLYDYTGGADFTLYVYKYNWLTVPDGYTTAHQQDVYMLLAAGASDAADGVKEDNEASVAGKTAGSWITVDLDPAFINKAGTTGYGLRSSRDVAATAPAGLEYQEYYAGDYPTVAYRPYLDVTHGAGGNWRVTRLYASGQLSPSPLNPL